MPLNSLFRRSSSIASKLHSSSDNDNSSTSAVDGHNGGDRARLGGDRQRLLSSSTSATMTSPSPSNGSNGSSKVRRRASYAPSMRSSRSFSLFSPSSSNGRDNASISNDANAAAAVSANDLLASFQRPHVQPASRRLSSLSSSRTFPNGLSTSSSSASFPATIRKSTTIENGQKLPALGVPHLQVNGSRMIVADAQLASSPVDELGGTGLVKEEHREISGDGRHTGDHSAPTQKAAPITAAGAIHGRGSLDSDDDDDQAYESPEEFLDSERSVNSGGKLTNGVLGLGRVQEEDQKQTPTPAKDSAPNAAPEPENEAGIPLRLIELAGSNARDTQLQADLRQIWIAVSLFLNSRMVDAENLLSTHRSDRLYYSLGYSLITSMKALMTFEPSDLSHAVELCKGTLELANRVKNKTYPGQRSLTWSERLSSTVGGVVRGSSLTVEAVSRMNAEQRHAELACAEGLLLKAVVGLIYAGDFLAFLREAFNMRTASSIYRTLAKFIDSADSKHPDKRDPVIDIHFRSGVSFGNGNMSLVLSLLPSNALKIIEIFGFSGNRTEALQMLMSEGGWVAGQSEPTVKSGPDHEGLRRSVCDLTLLTYHLIISSVIPVPDVDIDLADKILHYNLQRYPQGVFFLYFSGRLYSTQTRGKRAIEQYNKAIAAQKEYVQIQHICHWDLSLTHLSLADYPAAFECLSVLEKESNWSKAVYSFGTGITLYESLSDPTFTGDKSDTEIKEARIRVRKIMSAIPDHMRRIAGKSLPFEKYVARKSKKFLAQGDRLCLAGLELAYMLNATNLSPRYALYERHLKQITATLDSLEEAKAASPDAANLPSGWWDDYTLSHFLRAVVLQHIVRPEKHVICDPPDSPIAVSKGDEEAIRSFEEVLANSTKIELDHHIAWFAHFEYGCLLMKLGGSKNYAKAKEHFSTVLDNKVVLGPTKGKGKVSMQNVVILRANAAMEQLKALMAK